MPQTVGHEILVLVRDIPCFVCLTCGTARRLDKRVCRIGQRHPFSYGTDPDIDDDIAPHEYWRGKAPRFDRGIAEMLKLMETQPPFRLNFDEE